MTSMRLFRRLLYGARRPISVLASIAVVAVGFMPIDRWASAQPRIERVIATPVPTAVFTPVSMDIPRLRLEAAPIVPVGVYTDGTMQSPTNGVDVGWWLGRKPGQGNVLFAAHHDWNHRPGSFKQLNILQIGDVVTVHGPEGQLTYKVIWVRMYPGDVDATSLLDNHTGRQMVTLITCGGPFDTRIGHHIERVVARAVLAA